MNSMKKNVPFEDRFLPKTFNVLYLGGMLNCGFLLTALPFLVNVVLLNFQKNYLILLPLTGFFWLSSVAALFKSYDTWFQENGLSKPFQSYLRHWVQELKMALKDWLVFGTLICGNGFNIMSLWGKDRSFLNIFFVLLLVVLVGFYFSYLYLRMRNPGEKWSQLFMTAFYYLGRSWYLGLLCGILAGIWLFLSGYKPVLGFMVAPALMVSLLYICTRGMFAELRRENAKT